MSYETNTAANPTALVAALTSFATTNGWTTGSFTVGASLNKGQSHVAVTASGATTVNIVGANNAAGTVELCANTKSIYIDSANWPVTYHFFCLTNPDIIVIVLNYATTLCQTIWFGDIVKVHSSAFVGGNFYFGSKNGTLTNSSGLSTISDTNLSGGTSSPQTAGSCIPFDNTTSIAAAAKIHAKIDSAVWDVEISKKVTLCDWVVSTLFRSPNSWNSQAILIPMHLQFAMASSLYAYIGYIEHVRLLRIDNYEIGDVITLGSDSWKVFPFISKNATLRNGGLSVTTNHSGTVGFAVRLTS
jgi:hypothetical protein